ncbi:NAD-glutamate dehydrogenase [Paraferrimonas sedimenticola]|uniref:NAD-glutamate dehydrogenase n=1 Tax=Paraferrimonas sedimenticola TaxID=375674 RepID=A0AA37W0V6_9GAMM|nr:NAD-glutamate dehydrogenase [Paraferrimonas sedimenticola]GLP98064.1 NAD-glutamate dehydrogenase [Paraferrimonas sedimenticola]
MPRNHAKPSVLLENVVKLIRSKLPESSAELVESFVSTLYEHMPEDDLQDRNDSDLYGAGLSLWNQLNALERGGSFIRVFNPQQTKHGWQSNHTVVEIIQPDMPFLTDSVAMLLNRLGYTAHVSLHTPMRVTRDDKDKITSVKYIDQDENSGDAVAIFLIEIDRLSKPEEIKALEREIESVSQDVQFAVNDWEPMTEKLGEIIDALPKAPYPGDAELKSEAIDFLSYLKDHHFTLLGYRSYDLKKVKGDLELVANMDSSLGLMKRSSTTSKHSLLLSSVPASARKEALNDSLLILTKSNSKSRVHRPAHIDYLGVKRFDKKGNVVGEDRFIGLYASNLYNRSTREIPFLSNKVQRIMDRSGLTPNSHDYKALLHILETYPRDEIIQGKEEDLGKIANGVLQMQDRDKLKIFVRRDCFGRFLSCMVYVSKERYNTKLRIDTQKVLADYFETKEPVEFTTYFSESTLARTHYLVKVDNNNMDIDVKQIESNLIEAARQWEDKLDVALHESFGEERGRELAARYAHSFPRSYKEEVLPSSSVVDIEQLERLDDSHKLGMLFYQPQEDAHNQQRVRLKLFHKDEPIHLSDVMPMLENFGLRVINERPYEITTEEGATYWILDFLMTAVGVPSEALADSHERFQEAMLNVWNNELENDGFNRLVLAAGLTGREVSILRGYAKYMRQIDATFSQSYIEEAFASYPHFAGLLVNMFSRKFNPKLKTRTLVKLINQVELKLEDVASLDHDRIIRRYLDLIYATLRTNFYQDSEQGTAKSYISFKFAPEQIPEMPLPMPKFEIFVYSPRVEGVHLRGGKVARGGLRWSDRREDFRTEVLGLVKAQQVKNTVIVPVGAKGGFVCKQLPTEGGRDAFFKEGQECYRIFIRALLDITDNISQGQIVPPKQVVRHDEDDPYLVVAADKGTATFSDIANEISEEYGHWLGDAFASGGSNGYDHKKMGITARGGWESVKRHFWEMGIDCQTTDFTCVAIGDMGGDVFGNGMLLSKHIRLQAAFNHMHIFIDPNPDAASSWDERKRLFELPRSSWEDYDAKLISKGGGVFKRSAKSIKLTPEIQQMLNTGETSMTPNALIQKLLTMEFDLLWNGGIGTYVKARSETHADVGDRANDVLRVNGNELNCRVVGEGGNLGLTQLGRIEFAANGGRINTDFIDNVGGVDCSDNEVNIKILLNGLVDAGDLTVKQRNLLLEQMTDEVADIVLTDCNDQTRAISVTQAQGARQLKEQIRFIQYLEREGKLDRQLEFLPNDEELHERSATGQTLTRPELSVLFAYAKMVLKEDLVVDEITGDEFLGRLSVEYFPQTLQQEYQAQIAQHPLRGEIIATSLANNMVNDMGLNFIQRLQDETGAAVSEVAICYAIAAEVFGMRQVTQQIVELNGVVSADVQNRMLYELRRNVRRACRWFLRRRNRALTIEQTIAFYRPVYLELKEHAGEYMVADEKVELDSNASLYMQQGVPQPLAHNIAYLSTLFSSLDVAQICEADGKPVSLVSETYFKLGAAIDLHWFLSEINAQEVGNHWQALARAAFREELDWQQRSLTLVVLRNCPGGVCEADSIIHHFLEQHQLVLNRWFSMLADFRTSSSHEFAKFSVALRELVLLIQHCDEQS